MSQDLKLAVRTLRRTPGFTLAALVCLACGVGVTTTIFSAVSGILLRPLPYLRDQEIVVVHALQADQPAGAVSWAEYLAWRDGTRTLSDIGLWLTRAHELSGPEGNERVDGAMVSANLLPLLGLQPMIGSGFPAGAELNGPRELVILSHALWQQRYGGDRAIVGRSIRVFNRAYTVVGVMPPGAAFPEGAQLWTPIDPTEEPPPVHRYAGHRPPRTGRHGGAGPRRVGRRFPWTPRRVATDDAGWTGGTGIAIRDAGSVEH